jgi:hypothetical protein
MQPKGEWIERSCADSAHIPGALPVDPPAFNPSECPGERLLQKRHILCEQKESERQHPQAEHRQE